MSKKPRVTTLLGSQHVEGSKECLNLHGSIFVRFFDDSERKSTRQILS